MHRADLVNDILDLSKVEAGKRELSEAEGDVPGVVKTVLKVLQERAERTGLPLTPKRMEHHGGTLEPASRAAVGSTATPRFPPQRVGASPSVG